VHLSQSANKLTWKAGLDYQVTPENFPLRQRVHRLQAGRRQPGTAPAVVPANYRPETITAFELGSKNTAFDNKLIGNVAAFYYIDKNMQYHAEDLINFDGGVDNLPQVDVYGIEGELTRAAALSFPPLRQSHRGEGQDHHPHRDAGQPGRQRRQLQFAAEYGETAFIDAEFGIPNRPCRTALVC